MDLRASSPTRLFPGGSLGLHPRTSRGRGGAADLLGWWSRRGALSVSTTRVESDTEFKS